MLKRLPILCAALLALAACSHDNGNAQPPAPSAASTTPAAAPAASVPATPAATGTTATASTAASAATASTAAASPAPNAPPAAPFVDNGKWVEGKDYTVIDPAQPRISNTDKIEVVEAFSYGCPACNAYHPTMNELVKEMPRTRRSLSCRLPSCRRKTG